MRLRKLHKSRRRFWTKTVIDLPGSCHVDFTGLTRWTMDDSLGRWTLRTWTKGALKSDPFAGRPHWITAEDGTASRS